MLVNLAQTFSNPYTKIINYHDNEYIMDKYLNNLKSYFNKLSYSNSFRGMQLCRLNLLIPKIDSNIFYESINKDIHLKNILYQHEKKYTIHAPYQYNYFSKDNYTYIKEYYIKLMCVKEHLGINNFHICNHLRFPNEKEAVEVLCRLFYDVKDVSKYFCIENCDRSTDLLECLKFCNIFDIPCIFDNLHNRINGNVNIKNIIATLVNTWYVNNSSVIIHYSVGDKTGKHLNGIDFDEFFTILNVFKEYCHEIYVVIEVNDAINAIREFRQKSERDIKWNNDFTLYI